MKILLKEIREKKELSLRQMEILTGVSRSALSRIENEEVCFDLETAEKIAKGLHIKINDLFDSQYK